MYPAKSPDSTASHSSNIFDIIRLLAALCVMFSHHFAFSGLPEPKVFGVTKLGTFSVIVFFSISGFLITQSYLRTSSVVSYFKKRVLRIFPALIACSFFITFIICTIFGKSPAAEYIFSLKSVYNFVYFSFFGSHSQPEQMNFFSESYIYPNALNSSLWTLFFEFFDYIAIVLFINNKKHPAIGLIFLLAGSVGVQVLIYLGLKPNYYIDRSTILTIPFAIGGLMLITRHYWYRKRLSLMLLVLSFVGVFFSNANDERSILFFISVPVSVIIISSHIRDRLINGKFDYSYGIYIYAFPIQQVIINNAGFSFFTSLMASLMLTLIMAGASWHLIEKRIIKRKAPIIVRAELA